MTDYNFDKSFLFSIRLYLFIFTTAVYEKACFSILTNTNIKLLSFCQSDEKIMFLSTKQIYAKPHCPIGYLIWPVNFMWSQIIFFNCLDFQLISVGNPWWNKTVGRERKENGGKRSWRRVWVTFRDPVLEVVYVPLTHIPRSRSSHMEMKRELENVVPSWESTSWNNPMSWKERKNLGKTIGRPRHTEIHCCVSAAIIWL